MTLKDFKLTVHFEAHRGYYKAVLYQHYQQPELTDRQTLLAAGIGSTPEEALLNAAKQWAGA